MNNSQLNINDQPKKFSAPWSITLWILTITVTLLIFVVLPIVMISFLKSEDAYTTSALLITILPIILIIAVLFAPRNYSVTKSAVIINRFISGIILPIENIINIEHLHRRDIGFVIRLFGVGGFFGYYGKYYSFKKGLLSLYVTNTKKLVFIETNTKKKILLSPDNPDEFVNLIKQLKN